MQFERDPETSDTDNDVQFKVSSSFFLNSISGWDRGPHSHTPHPEMERGGGVRVQKRAIPAGRRVVRQPVVRCSCQRKEEKTGQKSPFTLNS